MVEYLIVLAVVGVAGIGAWAAFSSSLASKTGAQTALVLAMGESSGGDAHGEAHAHEHGEPVGLPSSVTKSGARPRAGSLTGEHRAGSVDLAARLAEARGTANAADVARVSSALARIPPGVLRRLEAEGVEVVVGRGSVTDAVPSLRGVHPRGWPAGKTWDNVDGMYHPAGKDVVVATSDLGRGRRGLTRKDSEAVLYHEIGHALDYETGYPSRSEAFRTAYQADQKKLTGYEKQGGHAGPEEAFAESFRHYLTGDPNFRKHQPNLWAYWNSDPLEMFGDE